MIMEFADAVLSLFVSEQLMQKMSYSGRDKLAWQGRESSVFCSPTVAPLLGNTCLRINVKTGQMLVAPVHYCVCSECCNLLMLSCSKLAI